jgi:hypothetical protein
MKHSVKTHLIDPNFQSQHSGKCDLLLRITSSRFSYAVVDQAQDQLKALCDIDIEGFEGLEEALGSDILLNFDFHKVKIATETSKFTFIPSLAYSEQNLKEYAHFIKGNPAELSVTDIRIPQIKNITSFDPTLQRMLDKKFISYKLFSSANPLIESGMKLYSGTENQLLLNFNGTNFEAAVFQGSKLAFYNLFRIDTVEDFNYFLLLILQEFKLDQGEGYVIIAGDIGKDDEKFKRLQKYFPEIKHASGKLIIQIPDLFQSIPAHHFFSLIALNLCE